MKRLVIALICAAALFGAIPTTAQTPSLPYSEGFESTSPGGLPSGWISLNGSSSVAQSSAFSHGGTRFCYVTGGVPALLILPQFATNISSLQLTAWVRCYSSSASCGDFDIGYITNTSNANTFVAVQTFNYSTHTGYVQHNANFGSAPAGARIAFRARPVTSFWQWVVDDILVEEAGCGRPSSVSTTSLTAHSATLAWPPSGMGETQYQYLLLAGGTPDWDSATLISANSVALANLSPNTQYTFHLRSYCSATEQGTPISYSFHTGCDAVTPAEMGVIGFEAGEGYASGPNNLNNCWSAGFFNSSVTSYPPYIVTDYGYQNSSCLRLYTYLNYGDCYAIMPEVTFPHPDAAYRLRMQMRKLSTSSGSVTYADTLYIARVDNPANPANYQIIGHAVNSTTSYMMCDVPLPRLPDTTRLMLLVKVPAASTSGRYASFYVDDIEIVESRNCLTPDSISVVSLAPDTIQVAWSGNADTNHIYLSFQPVDNPDTCASWCYDTVVTTNPARINVVPGSQYYLFIQGHCTFGESEFNLNGVHFHSGCFPIVEYPWSEDFESGTHYEDFDRPCWANVAAPGQHNLLFKYFSGSIYGSNRSMKLRYSSSFPNEKAYLTLPAFSIPMADAYAFSVDIYRPTYVLDTNEGLYIVIENGQGGTDTSFISTCFSHAGSVAAETEGGWYTYAFPLPKAGLNTITLFACSGNHNTGEDVVIDNLSVYYTSACPRVRDAVVTDVQSGQASLAWANAGAPAYQVLASTQQVLYDQVDLLPDSLVAYNDTLVFDTLYTARGLHAGTRYYFYVRSRCSDESGVWYGPLPVVTPFTIPYYQDFDAVEDFPFELGRYRWDSLDSLLAGSTGLTPDAGGYSWHSSSRIAPDTLTARYSFNNPGGHLFATPALNCDGFRYLKLSFDICKRAYDSNGPAADTAIQGDYFYIFGADSALNHFELLAAWDNDTVIPGAQSLDHGIGYSFQHAVVALPYSEGYRRILFAAGANDFYNPYDIHIDNISIAECPDTFIVTLVANDSTLGAVFGSGRYVQDSEVSISAVPADSNRFLGWSDGDTQAVRTLVVVSDTTLEARFEWVPVGINPVSNRMVAVAVAEGRALVVRGAEGQLLRLYDVTGRMIECRQAAAAVERFGEIPAAGIYLLQVGRQHAQKIVIR